MEDEDPTADTAKAALLSALKDAEVADQHGTVNPRKLGKYLSAARDRFIDGLTLQGVRAKGGHALAWSVTRVG